MRTYNPTTQWQPEVKAYLQQSLGKESFLRTSKVCMHACRQDKLDLSPVPRESLMKLTRAAPFKPSILTHFLQRSRLCACPQRSWLCESTRCGSGQKRLHKSCSRSSGCSGCSMPLPHRTVVCRTYWSRQGEDPWMWTMPTCADHQVLLRLTETEILAEGVLNQ